MYKEEEEEEEKVRGRVYILFTDCLRGESFSDDAGFLIKMLLQQKEGEGGSLPLC